MHKLLGELKKGLIFVVSAPAGTGKTTLVRMLCEEFDCVHESVSFTTRGPHGPMKCRAAIIILSARLNSNSESLKMIF